MDLAGVKIQYVGFTNDEDGVAISGSYLLPGTPGSLYATRDGGTH